MLLRRAPTTALFPYTTLFRSQTIDVDLDRPLQKLVDEDVLRTGFTCSFDGQRDVRGKVVIRIADHHGAPAEHVRRRSEEHTSELQSPCNLVCPLLPEKKKAPR